MNLVEGNHSIVILSPAIAPLALSTLKDLEQFGKSSNVLFLPPFSRVEFGTQIALQLQEGRAEIIWKQPKLDSGFKRARDLASYFLRAYQSFEIKALGVNFNGVWTTDNDIDFGEWRRRYFDSGFLSRDLGGDLVSTEFKISIRKEGFVRNLTLSERDSTDGKGIQASVNNHFADIEKTPFGNYSEVVGEADKLLSETIQELSDFWIAI
jgi:hypothetical protein